MLHLAPKKTFFCHFLPGVDFRTSHWTIPFRTSEADNFDNPWKRFFDLKLCSKLCLVEEFGKEVFWDKNLEFLYNVHISKVTTTFLIVSPPSSILMSFSLIDTGACYTNTKWSRIPFTSILCPFWNRWQKCIRNIRIHHHLHRDQVTSLDSGANGW